MALEICNVESIVRGNGKPFLFLQRLSEPSLAVLSVSSGLRIMMDKQLGTDRQPSHARASS